MSREEAAAKAQYEAVTGKPWEKAPSRSAKLCREDSAAIVKAADAHDLAHGVHRIVLDEGTVERAARALRLSRVGPRFSLGWDELDEDFREGYRKHARAVLAATVHQEERV